MGGSISLVNATNLPLDISLDQLGPLYYENNVQPGGVFQRDTGAVHFTIKASYTIEGVDKNTTWTCVKPILIAAGAGVVAIGGAAIALPAAALGLGAGSALISGGAIVATVADVVLIAGGAAVAPGVAQTLIGQFGEEKELSSMGWYAGKHHRLKICGGMKHDEEKVGNGETKHTWTLLPLTLEYA